MTERKTSSEVAKAVAFHQRGQLAQAEGLYRAVLKREPKHFDALHLLGVIAHQTRNFKAAISLISDALKVNPNSAPAHSNIAATLIELKRYEEALANYDRALAIKPDDAGVLFSRSGVLLELKRPEEALLGYDRALAKKPAYAEALNSRGNALRELKRHAEALASYEQALAIWPDFIEALSNRGTALFDLKRYEDALASYDNTLAISPEYAEVHYNRGNALRELGRHDEALASYSRSLEIKTDYADVLGNRGATFQELGRFEEAAQDFRTLLSIRPKYPYAMGGLCYAKLYCCDWADYTKNVGRLSKMIEAGERASTPFFFLSVSDVSNLQLQCSKIYNDDKFPPSGPAIWRGERVHHDRIRIAYLSADFHNHAIAYLTAELFESHDMAHFETTALSSGPTGRDEMRTRLESAFTRFINVQDKTDCEVAHVIKDLEIDIAVDLSGYSLGGRLGICSFRPAPIQVSFLGYPGTTGANYIDYIFADRITVPEEQHSFYTEKVVYLPDTYQPNDSKRRISERTPTRQQVGLPQSGFVFCSFNNNYKITPAIFDIWMRLLERVKGSVLWLLEGSTAAIRNLRESAKMRGVNPDRLVFAPRVTLEDHLARHRLAGLFLDTLPYNAHTTASDALWADLPVLTCLGTSFAGRVAASLLHAVGLPELITETLEDYEALALKLAETPAMLAAIKAKLARNREIHPLFDANCFRRHIESAYETMWQRHQRGEPPTSFAVAPCQT